MTSILGSVAAASFRIAELPADLVLRNGEIYTVDAARTWVQSVAIGGRMALPGFHDSHVHLLDGGIALGLCDLKNLPNAAEVYAAIAKYAAIRPADPCVNGSGWDLPVFPEANPLKEDLDRIVPDRPAYLESADGHSGWANSKALALAGITKDTHDPPGGRIEREAATGVPNGALRESACDLVTSKIPEATITERLEGLRRARTAGQQLRQYLGAGSRRQRRATGDLRRVLSAGSMSSRWAM